MGVYLAVMLGPIVVALAAAVLIWWRTGAHGSAAPNGGLRTWTIIAAAIPLLVVTTRQVLGFPLWALRIPEPVLNLVSGPGFLWPLVLALVALVLLVFPLPGPRRQGAAEVSRRTMWTFTSTRLLFWLVVLLVVVATLTVAAGLASEPDADGRYRIYWVHNGGMASGTEIYGWHYSVPALVLLAVLVVLALLSLALLARPPLLIGEVRERDVALRRLRSRNVLLVALGGVAGHLGTILRSLSHTSAVRGSFPVGESGVIVVETPFSALTGSLMVAGLCLSGVALTVWLTVLLSVIPVPSRTRAISRTSTTTDRP